MPARRVVILHGFRAAPSSHWFGAVADDLRADGAEVVVVPLPDSASPAAATWHDAASEAIGEVDERTVVVAHSLGAITALRVLAARPAGPDLGAVVLVSGFDRPLTTLPELDAFTAEPLDPAPVAARIRRRVVVASDDDAIVDPALSRELADRLDAEFVEIPGGGHFLDRDGWVDFPALTRIVRAAV